MKKSFLIVLIITFFTFPAFLFADSRTVTITWTMSDTSSVQGYKVYFSEDSTMANKNWHEDCSTPNESPANTFTTICNNVEIVSGKPYYFEVSANKSSGEEAYSNTEKAIFVSAVQNLRVVSP